MRTTGKSVRKRWLPLVLACLCASACVQQAMPIIRHVDPVSPRAFTTLCVEHNADLANRNLHEVITDVVESLGFSAPVRQSAFAGECRFWLHYTATWAGRLPAYLQTADIRLFDQQQVIGEIRYDASNSHSRPDKFGTLRGKLEPLLTALLARVERERP